ncbi:MAG TPA: hypothetical protein VGL72_15605 [Bryobacteraceae bacterium]|jgi:hypothetical protein
MAFRIAVCLGVLVSGTILCCSAKGGDKAKPPDTGQTADQGGNRPGANPTGTVARQDLKYDTAAVIDFGAVVVEVREVPKDNPLSGVNLVVRTDSDATFHVYVAPVEFIKTFEITFRKGDNVHVIGSKVKFEGETVVLGREVRKDSSTLYLRGRNGAPYWTTSGKPSS